MAGLISIILVAIADLGSFKLFLVSLIFAGIFQILLGAIKLGKLTRYIPHNVIEGMMAGIGLILIMKQAPSFIGRMEGHPYHEEAVIIGLICLISLIVWDKFVSHRVKTIPGSLVVVVISVIISSIYHLFLTSHEFDSHYFVHLPSILSFDDFKNNLVSPDWSGLANFKTYKYALTIGVVASIESLLCVNGIEKLDHQGRHTNKNRELFAQGTGNILSGLFGGLPVTSVIVRSTVNLSAGAKTKLSAIMHGLLLLVAVFFLSQTINKIPLVSLSAILIFTGYKLAHPKHFITAWKQGYRQWAPFLLTLLVVTFEDLLIGVALGLALSTIFTQIDKVNGRKHTTSH
ncbi:MAG: SulP family inorganic anion transporter [Bacteriovoracaceae bacterium]